MKIGLERGKAYEIRLTSGKWVKAEFLGDVTTGGFATQGSAFGIRRTIRKQTRYEFRNLASGREVSIKSAVKIREAA